MRTRAKLLLCVLLMLVSVSFFACDIAEIPVISCSGVITFENEGLRGVEIKSSTTTFGKTNSDGEFSFEKKAKTLTIVPELEGYFFEPKSITITESSDEINFVAIKIEELSGEMVLQSIEICPTTIASYGDNYVYKKDGQDAIKAREISLKYNNDAIDIISNDTYLIKDDQNFFEITEDIRIRCGVKANLGFLINAYFNNYYTEDGCMSDTNYKFLNITNVQTNKDLEDGKIKYILYGINSANKAFTFDISFTFDFIEDVEEQP